MLKFDINYAIINLNYLHIIGVNMDSPSVGSPSSHVPVVHLPGTPVDSLSLSPSPSGRASPLASPAPLSAHGHAVTQPASIPIGDITINDTRRGVYIFFTNEDGARIPLPPGITIDIGRLKRCTEIFNELVTSEHIDFATQELESVSAAGFKFKATRDTDIVDFSEPQTKIWTRFRTLLLEGAEREDAVLCGAFDASGSPAPSPFALPNPIDSRRSRSVGHHAADLSPPRRRRPSAGHRPHSSGAAAARHVPLDRPAARPVSSSGSSEGSYSPDLLALRWDAGEDFDEFCLD